MDSSDPLLSPVPGPLLSPVVPTVTECPPATPQGIEVEGRGWWEPQVTVSVMGTRFLIRVTDARQPEWWLHLYVSEEIATEWARIAGLRPDPE